MSHLYFNEESDYSEENICGNEGFLSTILHHRKKLNIFTLRCRFITYRIYAYTLHYIYYMQISIGANADFVKPK